MAIFRVYYKDLGNASTCSHDFVADSAKRTYNHFCKMFEKVDYDIIDIVELVEEEQEDKYTTDDLGPNWW